MDRFTSGGVQLACHIARPAGDVEGGPGVILCHGFPIGPLDATSSGGTFPQLVDRMARELGCVTMTFNFRGCGDSEGDFSLQGWVDDLRAAISHLLTVSDAGRRHPRRHQHRRIDRHLRRRRRPACVGGGPAQPTCRLRRLGRAAASVPRARPGDRCDPRSPASPIRSTSGRGSSAGSGRSPRPGDSRRARCS